MTSVPFLRAVPGDPAYPAPLGDLGARAPAAVYLRGASWSPAPVAVGIVGARRASEGGRRWARALGGALARAGVAVISGGALGIDGAAHEGALAEGGRTLAILPSPVWDPVPRTHRPLFETILDRGGTLLSELDTPVSRDLRPFRERNRMIAALSDVVVIVEASARSGTRHTAAAARSMGRTLLGKRWPPSDPRGDGQRDGAYAAVASVEEVVARVKGASSSGVVETTDPLWQALQRPLTTEALADALAVDDEELSTLLFQAELDGTVERAGGRWRRGHPKH